MPVVNAINTINTNSWEAQNSYIERIMDNAAYSAAHPDDTLVVVGPPRFRDLEDLTPIGMMQNFSVSQSRPFQPMMAIGSGRQFFLGGKAQGSANIGRLFVNGQSLMRKLYSMYNLEGAKFQDSPSGNLTNGENESSYFVNLDSEMFLIPFGLGCIMADKSGTQIGAFYMELCVIPSYSIGVSAGQSMILESVAVMFDRIVGLPVTTGSSETFAAWNKIITDATKFTGDSYNLNATGA